MGAALNAVIGVCYLTITWLILRGLWQTHQVRSNVLALATAAIFFTCGVHHGGHMVHAVLPALGIDRLHGLAMRAAFTSQMDVWDVIGAAVALFYLSLRRSYARLLDRPEMFENTMRQRYEEQLERERAALAEAQRLARVGSWEWDLREERMVLSDELCRLLGQPVGFSPPPAEMMEQVHPEDREAVAARMQAARQGEASESEHRIVRLDGEVRYVRARRYGRQNQAGEWTHMIGTMQDITETKAVWEDLRAAEERLRATIDHAPIGVALVELREEQRGRLLSTNEALCALLGQPCEALLEMALASVVHPEDAEAVLRELSLMATDDQARWELELRCLHRDGHIIWVLLSAAAVSGGTARGRYAVVHARDIGERKRFEGELQYLADHDALTSLYNRRRFEEELGRAVARAERYEDRGAVLMIDLDGFKYVNDSLGHSYGDQLITRVGGLLQGSLRTTDVVARLGGDEFAVILPHVQAAEALTVCEKILEALQGHEIGLSENRHARVTASIGVTSYGGAVRLTAEELMVEADIAMYEAKGNGRNQTSVYERDRDQRTGVVARQSWLERLKTAIGQERFELMAQPIRGICANGVDRYELLLRLRGDDDDLIPPGTFLYIAERLDLIQQIDRWVFAQAVMLLDECNRAGHDVSLSVNMSGKTLNDPVLLDDIEAIVGRRPVRSERLVVEVTETAAIVNIDKARHIAQGLRALGCQFALDDFGAGFASFYYLKHLEFDYLKIDGEFIKALILNPTDQLVVQSVVNIARGLGAKTVAEFVGDDATVQRLRELGVDYGQGYHLGRPRPVQEVLSVLV